MGRLIFDGQVFQTPAFYRGMGKYSYELIKSVAEANSLSGKWDGIDVILSKNLETNQKFEKELTKLNGIEVHYLDLKSNDILNPTETTRYNRSIVDDFAKMIPDNSIYLILSLMQGEISPTFPSDRSVDRAVLFYDLIPLTFHKIYLQNPITRKEYLSKISELISTDVYLTISKTVANDLSVYLGIDPERIINIDGGAIAHGAKMKQLTVSTPFILMPTGNDLRKNNHRGIEGFNIFNKRHNNKYTLVVTSFFKDEQIRELSQLSDRVVFTGNISGEELNYLYANAELLLFPSEYEGLGLPVLEALDHDLRVACSDITVFREISTTAFSLFDPTRTNAIADALDQALMSSQDKYETKRIQTKYTWKNTAALLIDTLPTIHASGTKAKENLLIISGDMTSDDRVGKFILQAHAEMNRLFDLTYYEANNVAHTEQRINFLPYISSFDRLSVDEPIPDLKAPLCKIYHLTNHKSSALPLMWALAEAGIVILHDDSLENAWNELYRLGLVSKARYQLEKEINKKYNVKWTGSVIANQRVVIVFSEERVVEVRRVVQDMSKKLLVEYFALPANKLVYPEVISEKKQLNVIPSDVRNLDDLYYEVSLSHSKRKPELLLSTSTDDLLIGVELEKYYDNTISGYNHFATHLKELLEETNL